VLTRYTRVHPGGPRLRARLQRQRHRVHEDQRAVGGDRGAAGQGQQAAHGARPLGAAVARAPGERDPAPRAPRRAEDGLVDLVCRLCWRIS
jgi:hypothetical protein